MGTAGVRSERRNDIDWVRTLAVLLLIPFHTALIFDTFEPFNVKNDVLSPFLSYAIVQFVSIWQMPLLFLLAGASTWYALRSRSSGQYVVERFKRLLIPFFFGILVIVPPETYYTLKFSIDTDLSYLQFYPQLLHMLPPGQSDFTAVGLMWAHLWFILFLFAISLIALPLILLLDTGRGRRALAALAGALQRGAAILLLALPLPFVLFLLPEIEGQPFFMYLLVFVYGFVLMADARYGESLQKSRRAALILAITCTAILMAVWVSGREFADFSLPSILVFFLRSFSTWFWIVAILGYGQKYLNMENRVLRYAREGSYPFYILHETVVVIIGYYVIQWSAGVLPKFLVIAGCSLVLTAVLYDVVVRRTNVTRFLFGMRPLPRQPSAPEAAAPSGRPAA